MAEWNAGSIRISMQDEAGDARSLLITGSSRHTGELAHRLSLIGVPARAAGHILVASASVKPNAGGTFAEFDDSCTHQTLQEATRHALRRIGAVLQEYGIEAEVVDEAPQATYLRPFTPVGYYTAGAR